MKIKTALLALPLLLPIGCAASAEAAGEGDSGVKTVTQMPADQINALTACRLYTEQSWDLIGIEAGWMQRQNEDISAVLKTMVNGGDYQTPLADYKEVTAEITAMTNSGKLETLGKLKSQCEGK